MWLLRTRFLQGIWAGGEEDSDQDPTKTIALSDEIGILMAAVKALAEKVFFLEKKLEN